MWTCLYPLTCFGRINLDLKNTLAPWKSSNFNSISANPLFGSYLVFSIILKLTQKSNNLVMELWNYGILFAEIFFFKWTPKSFCKLSLNYLSINKFLARVGFVLHFDSWHVFTQEYDKNLYCVLFLCIKTYTADVYGCGILILIPVSWTKSIFCALT